MDLTMPSARLAMPRGSRLYGSPVVGSSTSQTMKSVVSPKNGSMQQDDVSGICHMSDSLIAFHPAIDEPSNIMPSANVSSSIMVTSKVTCCHLPRGSVNRKSTYLTSLSLIIFMTFFGVVMVRVPFRDLLDASATGSIALRAGPREQLDQQFRWRLLRIPPS